MRYRFIPFFLLTAIVTACSSTQKNNQRTLETNDLLLLESAVRIQEMVGSNVWPMFGDFKTAVLFQVSEGQVLLNAHNPPPEFTPYNDEIPYWGSPAFKTKEIHTVDGTSMPLPEYQNGYFASAYSSEQTGHHYTFSVFVLDSISQFHKKGNAWPVEDWMSIFWHEVFHNFQDTQYATDFPTKEASDFKNIEPLLENYEYLELVKSELEIISKGLKNKDPKKKKQILCQNLAKSRAKRASYIKRNKLEKSFVAENFYETSEGTARYVEEKMLLAIARHPELGLIAKKVPNEFGFSAFKKYKKRKDEEYFDRIKILHPGERYFYQTGFSIALALDQMASNWKKDVFSAPMGIYSILQDVCAR